MKKSWLRLLSLNLVILLMLSMTISAFAAKQLEADDEWGWGNAIYEGDELVFVPEQSGVYYFNEESTPIDLTIYLDGEKQEDFAPGYYVMTAGLTYDVNADILGDDKACLYIRQEEVKAALNLSWRGIVAYGEVEHYFQPEKDGYYKFNYRNIPISLEQEGKPIQPAGGNIYYLQGNEKYDVVGEENGLDVLSIYKCGSDETLNYIPEQDGWYSFSTSRATGGDLTLYQGGKEVTDLMSWTWYNRWWRARSYAYLNSGDSYLVYGDVKRPVYVEPIILTENVVYTSNEEFSLFEFAPAKDGKYLFDNNGGRNCMALYDEELDMISGYNELFHDDYSASKPLYVSLEGGVTYYLAVFNDGADEPVEITVKEAKLEAGKTNKFEYRYYTEILQYEFETGDTAQWYSFTSSTGIDMTIYQPGYTPAQTWSGNGYQSLLMQKNKTYSICCTSNDAVVYDIIQGSIGVSELKSVPLEFGKETGTSEVSEVDQYVFSFTPSTTGKYTFESNYFGDITVFDPSMNVVAEESGSYEVDANLTKGETYYLHIFAGGVSSRLKATVTGDICMHSNTKLVTDLKPTCKEVGKGHKECTACGATVEEGIEIPTESHDSGEWVTTKKATATTDGLKELKCTKCGTVLDSKVIKKTGKNTLTVFNDLKKSDWYVKNGAIDFVYNQGLFSGTSTTTFGANDNMTRGMFVTVLGRLHGVKSTKATTKFTDVKKNAYYSGFVAWASKNGIVSGTSATTFGPEDNINREQICAMMVRYCNFAGIKLKKLNKAVTFNDAKSISSFAKKAVAACQTGGIVGGEQVGSGYRFRPKGNATRAEVATIMMKFYNNYIK